MAGTSFFVLKCVNMTAVLKGTDYRLLADAPIPDLSVVQDPELTGAAPAGSGLRWMSRCSGCRSSASNRSLHNEMSCGGHEPEPALFRSARESAASGRGQQLYEKSSSWIHPMRVPAHGIQFMNRKWPKRFTGCCRKSSRTSSSLQDMTACLKTGTRIRIAKPVEL